MPKTDSQRLDELKAQRDELESQLSDIRVTSYTTADGRSVTRDSAQKTLGYLKQEIRKLELRVNGPAVNYVRLGGRS
jgi:uncharacterized coiled-coil DUF342 family protein